MIKKSFLFVLAILVFVAVSFAGVKVSEVEMAIPTYLSGPEDPNPPLWNLRVYPYPLQTDITRQKVNKNYRVVILENDYIKVLILPEIGGRILAALDKTNNDFDFVYHNQVIKPGLIGLRGAWLSGGIEWNFPTLGHTVNTFAPVNYKIISGQEDGSATCVVGTEEWVRRMKWEVFITLYPDRSSFKTTVRLSNRTLVHNNAYFWANAAVHAWPETRVIFPPSDYTFAGGRRNPRPWPLRERKDVSWYKNTPYAHDFFCASEGDFNAAYNYDRDNGTVHYSLGYESPGKKFWTWGTAPSGMIWEGLLTDKNGQYIEVQSGRLLTQGDTWIFEPHLVEQWEEWWYPVKKMQGLVKANQEAAVNLEARGKKLFVAFNAVRELRNAEVKIFCEGEQIFSERLELSPASYYLREIPAKGNGKDYKLKLLDREGKIIIDYTTEEPKIPAAELQPDLSEVENTAEVRFLKGYYALKHWDEEGALQFFEEALEIEPEFTPALEWLGIIHYRNGKTKEALAFMERILNKDEDNLTARYYRALSKIRLGIEERTELDLHIISRRAAYRHVAPYVLAGTAIKNKDYRRTVALLRQSLKANPDDDKAKVMLAAALKHLDEKEEAGKLLEEALEADPLSPLAIIEKKLFSGESRLEILRGDPEYYLEVATDYAELNLLEEAAATIKLYLSLENSSPYPLLDYYLGYFSAKLGKQEEASGYFKKAADLRPDFVFPFRTETEEVLRLALEHNPADWKAHYYLGNLFTVKLRWEEGLESFHKAAGFSPSFSVLYRNLGEIYWRKKKDWERAEEMYEKALSLASQDLHLYLSLDELYALRGKLEERDKLYGLAPRAVKENFNYILSRAKYLVDAGKYDEALKILKTNTFLPWEGWTGAREVYVLALMRRAELLIRNEKYREAIKDLEAAMEYPENLGTGRPPAPVFAKEHYLTGECYEKMGNKKLAEKHYRVAAEYAEVGLSSEASRYKALALKKLGRKD